ncbi:transposase [Kitasatospora sp. NPDC054939]
MRRTAPGGCRAGRCGAGAAARPGRGARRVQRPEAASVTGTTATAWTGISATLAQVIIAEIGVDMSRFATAGHLASWAGMCPGNKESAGKRLSGRTRHGDTWLKTALFMAGTTAARGKSTYLGAQYRRLVRHRGSKRAIVAVGHSILVSAWHILHGHVPYQDLGADHFTTRLGKDRHARRLIAQLAALGLDVTVTARTGAA